MMSSNKNCYLTAKFDLPAKNESKSQSIIKVPLLKFTKKEKKKEKIF